MPDNLSDDEVKELLFGPKAVWAPDGSTFVVTLIPAETGAQIFDNATWRLEIRGPNEHRHLWISSWNDDFVEDPAHADVPKSWTVKAKLAVGRWLDMQAALEG